MDHKERIEQLKAEIQRLAGGEAVIGIDPRLPPETAVQFLERVLAVEKEDAKQRQRDAN